ncbi:MAG: glycosyltransferase family 2 protein [Clostridia bacterium]|nr:glycosyltransferase family 2 protein [Clostridia bacterium]
MNLEVLVTTMHQNDTSKYEQMNLKSDAIIANQANDCSFVEEKKGEHIVKMITTNTRGTSINRNMAIMYATANYIMFADDDMVLVDDYEQLVEEEFKKCPTADAIKFYCESTNPQRQLSFKKPKALKKATKRNIMSAGVVGLVLRRDFLEKNCIYFQKNIGPGNDIYCGEDSVFLSDILSAKAKMYVSPKLVSYINQGESSWNEGLTERRICAMGYIYSRVYGRAAILAMYRRAYLLRKKTKNYSFLQLIQLMKKGMKQQRNDK